MGMQFQSLPMQHSIVLGVIVAFSVGAGASAQQPPRYVTPTTPPMVVVAQPAQMQANLGGGFIEYLFGDRAQQPPAPPPVFYSSPAPETQPLYANAPPAVDPMLEEQAPGFQIDPQFVRQTVDYQGKEEPGTIIIDTPNHFLYLVEPGGKAMRYGIGVGRPGFTWSGTRTVTAKKEWPDWVPPEEM